MTQFILKDVRTKLYLSATGLTDNRRRALRFLSKQSAQTEIETMFSLHVWSLVNWSIVEIVQ